MIIIDNIEVEAVHPVVCTMNNNNMIFYCRQTQLVFYIESQLGYMFRPCGGHHQASTMY
jgi:hypothetical protein